MNDMTLLDMEFLVIDVFRFHPLMVWAVGCAVAFAVVIFGVRIVRAGTRAVLVKRAKPYPVFRQGAGR